MFVRLLFATLVAIGPLSAQTLHQGSFEKKKVTIKGSFTITEKDGRRVLTLSDDFSTKKGPDLQIVFSPLSFDEVKGKTAMGGGSVSIGYLKNNKGGQEYDLPEDLDLTRMKCILIHCVDYSKLWGGAPL